MCPPNPGSPNSNNCQKVLSVEHLAGATVKQQLWELGSEGDRTSSGRSDASHQLLQPTITQVSSPSTDTSSAAVTAEAPPPAATKLATEQEANRIVDDSGNPNVTAFYHNASGVIADSSQPATALTLQQEQQQQWTLQDASMDPKQTPQSPAQPEAAQVPPIAPLPPPSPSEGPQVHDEYQHYLQRFEAGDTLAQRWHRLKHSEKWDELREDWEEWQSDLLLQQLQASNAASRGGRGKSRNRKEIEVDDLAPRRTRARRAPTTFQDYQVDTPASAYPAPGAALQEYTAASYRPIAGAGLNHGLSVGIPMQRQGCSQLDPFPLPEQHRSNTQQQQQQQQRPGQQVYQHQQQVLDQPPQQQQHSRQPAVGGQAVSQDLMCQLYHMGAQLGAALQQGGSATVNGPTAIAAAVEAMCSHTFHGDAAAMMKHLAVAFNQQQR